MKVYVYPADETGCGYYRLIWPAMALRAMGHDVSIVTKKQMADQFQARMVGNEMMDVTIPADADVMVLQRPTHNLLQQAVPLIRSKRVAVVVDMDDDLSSIDPRNPAFTIMHPGRGGEHTWQAAQRVCELATLVTVSTQPLLDVYARKCRGVVLKNYVPHYFTQVPHFDSHIVGWGGSIHSHPDDLQTMGPAIAQISREAPFLIVGPDKGVAETLGESIAARVETTGPIEFIDWNRALADSIGIGLAPTADTKFNRAKSWLKPLEYAACGIPPISSARPEYVELKERHGVGWIASSPKDWRRMTMKLVRDEDLRNEIGALGRQIVAASLTIERNAHRWMEAWELALRLERG